MNSSCAMMVTTRDKPVAIMDVDDGAMHTATRSKKNAKKRDSDIFSNTTKTSIDNNALTCPKRQKKETAAPSSNTHHTELCKNAPASSLANKISTPIQPNASVALAMDASSSDLLKHNNTVCTHNPTVGIVNQANMDAPPVPSPCTLDENVTADGIVTSSKEPCTQQQQQQQQQEPCNRVPPLQLASFASEESLVGSSSDDDDDDKEQENTTTAKVITSKQVLSKQPRSSKKYGASWLKLLCSIILLLVTGFMASKSIRTPPLSHYSDNCVMIGGGGYSGFYYMHGLLHKQRQTLLLNDNNNNDGRPRDVLCYSAGCLNAVALWSNYTIDQVIDFGEESQYQYTSGQMPWIKATNRMVHNLIHGKGLSGSVVGSVDMPFSTRQNDNQQEESPLQHLARTNAKFLSSLHIITTTTTDWGWPTMSIRTPETVQELQEMMLQTSWIPFATGDWWMKRGHLDGFFTMWAHPTCPNNVGISLDWRIYFNMVNVLMPASLARQLYENGRQHVLQVS